MNLRTRGKLLVAGLVALAIAPASAHAVAGDVYVADYDAGGPPGEGGVYRIGPPGGTATLFAGPSALFSQPTGLTMDADGSLLVADYVNGSILRVRNGTVSTVAQAGLTQPSDVARAVDGSLIVSDFGVTDEVYRVNPANGAVSTIHAGAPLDAPAAVEISRDGTIYVADENDGAIYRIPKGGTTPVLFSSGPLFSQPEDLHLSPDEKVLYASDAVTHNIVSVALPSGAASLVGTPPGADGFARLPTGQFVVSDALNDSIHLMGPTGSPISTFSSDAVFEGPHDVVVEPAKCSGKTPTIVGTNGKDKLRGSPSADVISTLGGADTVKSLGGKDTICGGGGPDALFGGTGSDKLLGQKGQDTMKGGKGKDVCKGGKSPDVGSSCEKGKV